ncbi:MAG: peptidoglycan DD-metalloendopeptidase family protein [Polyangiaceae bacterium]
MRTPRAACLATILCGLVAACGGDPAAPGDAGNGGAGAADPSGTSNGGAGVGGQGTSTTQGAGGAGGEDPLGECPRVKVSVALGASLNVRPDPTTLQDPVGSLPNNSIVDVLEIVDGETVEGNTTWYRIGTDALEGYISAHFATCTMEQPPQLMPPDAFYLPLECGTSAKVSQGNNGSFTHQGNAYYAFDFSLGLGTPLVAMADGVAAHVYADTGPGDPCYNGGGSECYLYANLVSLLHGDGSRTVYKHLDAVHVALGEFVPRGTIVGLSGSTGYSTGRHAHTMRTEDCPQSNCDSIPLEFADAPGDGVPDTGETVTSSNCP